jgi:phenylalanyl-tRNA synthetase beta chain
MIIDRSIRYEDIRKLAFQTEKEKLKNIALFDVFEGENIGKEKKSYAVSFILQDLNATLTDNQIDTIINRLASAFEKKLGAQIRK